VGNRGRAPVRKVSARKVTARASAMARACTIQTVFGNQRANQDQSSRGRGTIRREFCRKRLRRLESPTAVTIVVASHLRHTRKTCTSLRKLGHVKEVSRLVGGTRQTGGKSHQLSDFSSRHRTSKRAPTAARACRPEHGLERPARRTTGGPMPGRADRYSSAWPRRGQSPYP